MGIFLEDAVNRGLNTPFFFWITNHTRLLYQSLGLKTKTNIGKKNLGFIIKCELEAWCVRKADTRSLPIHIGRSRARSAVHKTPLITNIQTSLSRSSLPSQSIVLGSALQRVQRTSCGEKKEEEEEIIIIADEARGSEG